MISLGGEASGVHYTQGLIPVDYDNIIKTNDFRFQAVAVLSLLVYHRENVIGTVVRYDGRSS